MLRRRFGSARRERRLKLRFQIFDWLESLTNYAEHDLLQKLISFLERQ